MDQLGDRGGQDVLARADLADVSAGSAHLLRKRRTRRCLEYNVGVVWH